MPPKKQAVKKKAYAAAGVDVDLGNKVKKNIARKIKGTMRPEVLSKIGGFGGLFDGRFKSFKHPVLVSSIDGVGTKLKVASMMNSHHTIGEDLVNHCINDIAVIGAEPLFFLDYFGTGELDTSIFADIIAGLTRACKKANCALIGGETAQMPGLYHGTDYDLVGTIVGVVDKAKVIDGSKIKPGDKLIGFSSSGLHTNGYSLARKILFHQLRMTLDEPVPGAKRTLGEELLRTHINYQPLLKKLSAKVTFKGLSHITGGGFLDNIPRILPTGTAVEIQIGSWPQLPIFNLLQGTNLVNQDEIYQVFNMGIGMVAIVSAKDAEALLNETNCYAMGEVVKGRQQVKMVSE
ncbi:MAG: phosphoribosylformylglycinamidine cyclo-ligase [Verrucomicrobiota bacterium]